MSNTTRRSFLKSRIPTDARLVPAVGPAAAVSPALNRRTFLASSAGAAATVAVVAAGPRLATATLAGASDTRSLGAIVTPSGPPPAEAVMAFVRDAVRGEVTVLSGTRETTYRDPELAARLLAAGR